MRIVISLFLSLISLFVFGQSQSVTCIETGSNWKIFKPTGAPSKSFTMFHFEDFPTYSDDDWVNVKAPLGFNAPVLSTDLNNQLEAPQERVTFYLFNKEFKVQHYPTDIDSLFLRIRYNDAFVIYLNGVEVARKNLPAAPTPVSETTTATEVHTSNDYEWIDITSFKATLINGNAGVPGENQIAAEIHQSADAVKDLAFDLEVTYKRATSSAPVAAVVRNPYLQLSGPTTMTVKWRTNIPTSTELSYGTSQFIGGLTYSDPTLTTEHEAKLTGLTSLTKYYYTVQGVATYANDFVNQYFTTAPEVGADVPLRIWVIGDFGVGIPPQITTFHSYLANNVGKNTNLWMWAGDNAYQSGTDQQYQDYVFTIYDPIFRNHVVCPTTGNHDMESCNPDKQLGPYFDIFSLPKNGELGGVPSGTEAYNSYNYGSLHIINLESSKTDASANSEMAKWLKKDLAANTQKWTIAHFHHPLYSGGSHKSDDHGRSLEMRVNMLPLLEAGGVDLVITGHSHDYERTKLINGNYGLSTEYSDAANLIQGGNGKIDGDGAYLKPKESPYSQKGMIHALVGNSGLTDVSEEVVPLPMVEFSTTNPGSAIISISGDTLTFQQLDGLTQQFTDEFSIVKSLENVPCEITTNLPEQLSLCPGEALVLDAGAGFLKYNWNTGETNNKITVTQAGTYSLRVHKSASCYKDVATTVVQKLATGFTVDKEITMINESISFVDTTSNVLNRLWNFGNGDTSTLAEVSYSYATPGLYTVTLTNQNSECQNSATRQVVIADPSGIENTGSGELRILAFPNPTDGILNIELESKTSIKNIELELVNAVGALVFKKKIKELNGSHNERIDLNGSLDGAYFLSVRHSGGVFTKKVILH